MRQNKVPIIIGVIILSLFVLGITKDLIIKQVVSVVASQVTGAPVNIRSFSLGILNQSVRISGFRMYNPAGFPEGILIDLPKIYVKCDLFALLRKKIHLVNAEIELKEMGLVMDKDKKLNVDALKIVKKQEKPPEKKETKPKEQLPLQIDTLKLGIGRIVLKDYSQGTEPIIKVYDINIHKSYKNITSVQQLAALILSEPMKAAGIQGAAIYGVAMLAGAGILPVAIAAQFVGKDSVQQDFSIAFDKLYQVSLETLKEMGEVTKEDKERGAIGANIKGTTVALKLNKLADNKVQVIISARKYLLPQPEIAGGLLYKISEKLK